MYMTINPLVSQPRPVTDTHVDCIRTSPTISPVGGRGSTRTPPRSRHAVTYRLERLHTGICSPPAPLRASHSETAYSPATDDPHPAIEALPLPVDQGLQRPKLSQREREVLVMWLKQESKTEVGVTLYIAATTVRTHLQRIREKYAAVGRPAPTKLALGIRAIQDGLVSIHDL